MKIPILSSRTTTVPMPTSTANAAPPKAPTLGAAASARVAELEQKLRGYTESNEVVGGLYDQAYRVKMLDLGLPPAAQSLRLVMGWARTVVDVLAERLEPIAWADPTLTVEDAAELWEDTGAATAIPQMIVDMLIYGVGFLSATAGNPANGEPPVLVRAHSATSTAVDIDPRTGVVRSALTMEGDDELAATLWLPTAIVGLTRTGRDSAWSVTYATENRLGIVPMVAIHNAPRAGLPGGRSEITPAIRSALMSATRAIIAMDVNREFFAIPHRYLIGVAGDFRGADGSLIETWKLAARAMLKIPYSEDGGDVQVGEFQQVKAGPFLEQVEGLAKIVAAEAAIPAMYLGIEHANPSSADGFRAAESRLVRRSRTRIASMVPHLNRLGQIVLAIKNGTEIADTVRPRTVFADPATAAFSADADAWVKLIGAGAVPAGAPVVWRRMGFSEAEIAELQRAHDAQRPVAHLAAIDAALSAPDTYDPDVDTLAGGDDE